MSVSTDPRHRRPEIATYRDRGRASGIELHQPGNGGNLAAVFPWHLALDDVDRLLAGGSGALSPA